MRICCWCWSPACSCPGRWSPGSRASPRSSDEDVRMTGLLAALAALGPQESALPWPRHRLDSRGWLGLLAQLDGADLTLLALWADATDIHVALRDEADGSHALARLPAASLRFPSIGRVRPGAIRLERAIRDLHGIEAEEGPDLRPWLDHGQGYTFLPVEGEG